MKTIVGWLFIIGVSLGAIIRSIGGLEFLLTDAIVDAGFLIAGAILLKGGKQ